MMSVIFQKNYKLLLLLLFINIFIQRTTQQSIDDFSVLQIDNINYYATIRFEIKPIVNLIAIYRILSCSHIIIRIPQSKF